MKLQYRQESASSSAELELQSISDHELNHELLMKVDELEKLFAVYKLRLHGEHNTSSSHDDVGDVVLMMRGGKSYERYKQTRYAKLREEWATNRFYKESIMAALQDSLDRAQAEMKQLFATSPLMETKQQQTPLSSTAIVGKDEEPSAAARLEFSRNRSYNATSQAASSSSSTSITNSRKLVSSRSVSSRSSAGPIPRPSTSSIRTSPPTSASNRTADLRKENTKPRSHARSKSTYEETKNVAVEENHLRTRSLTRFASSLGELKDPNSNNVSSESKPFLRKGNGIGAGAGAGAGAGLAKKKSSMASEILGDESKETVGRLTKSSSSSSYTPFHDSGSEVALLSQRSRRSGNHPVAEDGDIEELQRHNNSTAASSQAHPLNQMRQADAIRARKRWGSTENPFSTVSTNDACQSPMDAIKGFNRLFSFGRKIRVTDSVLIQ